MTTLKSLRRDWEWLGEHDPFGRSAPILPATNGAGTNTNFLPPAKPKSRRLWIFCGPWDALLIESNGRSTSVVGLAA